MASASARKMKTKNAFENLALGRKSGVEKGGCWPKNEKMVQANTRSYL
jgi:hypothetical protein